MYEEVNAAEPINEALPEDVEQDRSRAGPGRERETSCARRVGRARSPMTLLFG